MDINMGEKLKELRKNKNMTQEQLAELVGLTPQSVSKWECGLGFPDVAVLPILASIFEVSIDVLFGYDISKTEEKVENILRESGKYFWNDSARAEEILKTALVRYPNNERLLRELLNLYESRIRNDEKEGDYEKAIAIGEKLISEAKELFTICSAKTDLASIYVHHGDYEKGKALIDSLPYMYPYQLNDKMRSSSYILRGNDRLKEAKNWKTVEIQELYIACEQEGMGFFEVGDYQNALVSFTQYRTVLELFMKSKEISPKAYLWSGMQTHHWCSYLFEAGCLAKLGREDEAKEKISRAYDIIEHAWEKEFEEKPDYFMDPFREEYEKMGLCSLALCK